LHLITDKSHLHTTNESPHSHTISGQMVTGAGAGLAGGSGATFGTVNTNNALTNLSLDVAFTGITTTQNTGTGATHTHTFTGDVVAAHQHSVTVDSRSPYYALAYIMKQ
jgi:hypothetical protein